MTLGLRSGAGATLCLLLAGATIVLGTRSPTKDALRAEQGGDVERAMAAVRELARAPRPTGSAANAVARLWIVDQLAPLTPEVEVQEGTVCDAFAGVTYCGQVRNVLARFGGSAPSLGFAFVAHYDSVLGSPGAADDGAGVATLLEVGRRLAASPHRNDVLLVFSDGEEDFLRGASLLSRHRWARGLKGAVNFEARGVSGPSALFFKGDDDETLLSPLGRAFNPSASSALVRLAQGLPNDSDATVLQRDGIPAIAFAFADGLEHYHRASDSADHLSPASVAHHLDHAAVLVSYFADLSPAAVAHLGSGAKVFFDVFGAHLFSYPGWLARALGFILLGGLLLLSRARPLPEAGRRLGRLLIALAGTSLFATLATAAIVTTRTQSRLLSLTVVSASLLLLLQLWGRTARDGGEAGRAAVAALWAFPAAVVGFVEPQVSYLLQWPALALLTSEVGSIPGWGRRALCVVAAASAVVLWSWWAYTLLVAAGDLPAPAAMAACFGATLIQVALGGDGRRPLTVAFGLCACATLWFTSWGPVQEVEGPEGLLHDARSAEVRRVSWNPQVDPWALRLADRGPAGEAGDLLVPTLVVEGVEPRGATRRIRLRASSRRGSSHLFLRELSGTTMRVVSVNGQPVGEIVRFSPDLDRWLWQRATGDRDSWRLQFAGLPAEGARIEIDVPATATPTFEVRDTSSEPSPSRAVPPIAASFARAVVSP